MAWRLEYLVLMKVMPNYLFTFDNIWWRKKNLFCIDVLSCTNLTNYYKLLTGEVVMITVAFLIVLFSLQRFGTSKVGLAVGPALFIWFCCLAGIGIYNIRIYGSQVLHAFNPLYIYYYFERNPTQAWMSLGGCLLCATGRCFDHTAQFCFYTHESWIQKENRTLYFITLLSYANLEGLIFVFDR